MYLFESIFDRKNIIPKVEITGIFLIPILQGQWDLQRINRAFFIPESITFKEALATVKKPRDGAVVYPFKRSRMKRSADEQIQPEGLDPKRRNRMPDVGAAEGRDIFLGIKRVLKHLRHKSKTKCILFQERRFTLQTSIHSTSACTTISSLTHHSL